MIKKSNIPQNKIEKIKECVEKIDGIQSGHERKMILYSRLPRTREQNPERYDNLVSFWQQTIATISRSTNLLIFTPNQLNELFKIEGVSPLSLFDIIEEIENQKNITGLQEFTRAYGNGWTSWLWNRVAVPTLKWSWSMVVGGKKDNTSKSSKPISSSSITTSPTRGGVGGMSSGTNTIDTIKERRLIVVDVINEKAEELYNLYVETTLMVTGDAIVSLAKLESSVVSDWCITRDELMLLIHVLERDGRVKMILSPKNTDIQGIKFAMPGQVAQELESDLGVLQLQITYDRLLTQQDRLSIDIDKCQSEVKRLMNAKQKNNALIQLKKKKLLESLLQTRMEHSNNIHQVLRSIESAHSNQQVVETLCAGVAALKHVNQKMTVDQVDDVMDDFSDAMANQAEFDNAIKNGTSSIQSSLGQDDDIDALEKELQEMEYQQNFEKQFENLSLSNKVITPTKNSTSTQTSTPTSTPTQIPDPIPIQSTQKPIPPISNQSMNEIEEQQLLNELMEDVLKEAKELDKKEKEKEKEKDMLPA